MLLLIVYLQNIEQIKSTYCFQKYSLVIVVLNDRIQIKANM
jgi:hypothetical protein